MGTVKTETVKTPTLKEWAVNLYRQEKDAEDKREVQRAAEFATKAAIAFNSIIGGHGVKIVRISDMACNLILEEGISIRATQSALFESFTFQVIHKCEKCDREVLSSTFRDLVSLGKAIDDPEFRMWHRCPPSAEKEAAEHQRIEYHVKAILDLCGAKLEE